jgi:hypothetical protein
MKSVGWLAEGVTHRYRGQGGMVGYASLTHPTYRRNHTGRSPFTVTRVPARVWGQ